MFDMKKKRAGKIHLLMLTVVALLFQGCSNVTPGDDVSSPEIAYYTEGAAATYTLSPTAFNAPNHMVSYPQMAGLKDEMIMNNINQSLSSEATAMITPEASEDTPVVVTYEVERMDANLLSIVYTGKQVIDGEALILKSAMTIDLATSIPITLQNIVKNQKGTDKLNELFSKKAVELGLKSITLKDDMTMSLSKDGIVVTFKDDILDQEFSEVRIPFSDLKEYLNIDFLSSGQ